MPKSPYSTKLIRSFEELQKLKKIEEARKQGKLPPATCIDLCDLDSSDSNDDRAEDEIKSSPSTQKKKDRTISASPVPPKSSASAPMISSAESTPTKPKMRFGKESKPWTAEENEAIVDHLFEVCDRPSLVKALQRPRSSVALQVERILCFGLAEANRKAR